MPTQPTVRSFAKTLSSADLAACVQDVITWQNTGTMPEGALSAYSERLVAEVGIAKMFAPRQAETSVLREAAIRFGAEQTGQRADRAEALVLMLAGMTHAAGVLNANTDR